MDDKTLLERAARAYGLPVGFKEGDYFYCEHGPNGASMYRAGSPHSHWNPLQDDGDEARLEAALNIDIEWHPIGVVASINGGARFREPYSDHGGDKQKARRYAGVRAAAAIGSAHEAQ